MDVNGRPRVLFLTQVLPYPLTAGPKVRAYYMLRHLVRSYDVTLVSFVREDDRPEDVAHLRELCAAVHTVPINRSRLKDGLSLLQSLLTGEPAVIVRDRLPAMQAVLLRLIRETPFAVVHADQTAMAQYALYARDAHAEGQRPRLLLDQHNALYLLVQRQATYERGPLRWIWRREAARLRPYEADLCRQFEQILTVTEEDRAALLALLPPEEAERAQHKFTAIPICVDPERQPPVPYVDQGPHILHLGTMFWPPNIEGVLWFAQEVLPLVLAQVPDATFTVAGKGPPPPVEALAEPPSPVAGHVEVTGFVPDVEPLLTQTRAFIVPVRAGGGMRVKIVDGWQWAVPVISTTIGAEGIDTRPGENILLADEPATFAEAVVQVLTDPELAQRLRENGRQWVESRYNWRSVYRQVDDIYEQLLRA